MIRYTLRDGQNRILYIGVTDNPPRRIEEHKSDGKLFSWLTVEYQTDDRQEAEDWEARMLTDYIREHGLTPPYNKTIDGKWHPHRRR